VSERDHDCCHVIEARRTLIGDQDAEMLGLGGGTHGLTSSFGTQCTPWR
jgi:hypothetical protein